MTELEILTLIAARAADLADRFEVAGQLVAAAHLRETARIAEDTVMEVAPPVPAWAATERAATLR